MSKWMVYDSNGAIWPPGFKSEIHPELDLKRPGLDKALQAANAARAQGKGWGKGEIAHLQKPLIPNGAPLQERSGFKVSWSCGGCGQSRTTTAGAKKIGGVMVCAECVAAKSRKVGA